MDILAPKMHILGPKMDKMYLLKRYSPSDSFRTFFSESDVSSIEFRVSHS